MKHEILFVMSANSFGQLYRFTTFGESHGPLIGLVIDGCPANINLDLNFIQQQLDRRRPGQSKITTPRTEADQIQVKSGVIPTTCQGQECLVTTGAPLLLLIDNKDRDSSKYEKFKQYPRPSHVDYTAMARYGSNVDLRGSGRFSGRLTAPMVAAGSIAQLILNQWSELVGNPMVKIAGYTKQIGSIRDEQIYTVADMLKTRETNLVKTMNPGLAEKMIELIEAVRADQDSVGGIISCRVEGLPAGIGNPTFRSLESDIAAAIWSIPAVRGLQFGTGFQAVTMRGSEHNDAFEMVKGEVRTKTNHAGGIVGGISNGMPIVFDVAFKPTASISKQQDTVNLNACENTHLKIEGRHDPCIVPRAIPIVEAMTLNVIIDQLMLQGQIPAVIPEE